MPVMMDATQMIEDLEEEEEEEEEGSEARGEAITDLEKAEAKI